MEPDQERLTAFNDRKPAGDSSSALEELRQAARGLGGGGRRGTTAWRRQGPVLAAVAAILVGAVLTFAGRFHYRCTATILLTGQNASEHAEEYRKAFLDHAWHRLSAGQTPGTTAPWTIDTPTPDRLRLTLTTPDRETGVAQVQSIAQSFLSLVAIDAEKVRGTPGEAEQAISQYVSALQERLAEAQKKVEADLAQVPETDARRHHDALLPRWREMVAEFATARERLSRAKSDVGRLESAPPPTHGVVSSEERREALEADLALQQDLRELKVQLSQLKLHLLTAHRQTGKRLDDLVSAAQGLRSISSDNQTPSEATGGARLRVARFTGEAERYRRDLAEFTGKWNEEFDLLQRLECDPNGAEVLEVYRRARSLLSDFLFAASERLASMRTHTHTMAQGLDDSARHHVLYSNVMRGFQTVQAAHHRFEFAAGAIEPIANFRLDAALKSSRGLRRRSQARVRIIDTRLETRARQRARISQLAELEASRKSVELVRKEAGKTIERILALQEELNVSAKLSEELLGAVLRAEYATSLADIARQDLSLTEQQLGRLRAKRVATTDAVSLEIVSCGVTGSPVNLLERLRVGVIGAGVTLVVVFLTHRWIGREPDHGHR